MPSSLRACQINVLSLKVEDPGHVNSLVGAGRGTGTAQVVDCWEYLG